MSASRLKIYVYEMQRTKCSPGAAFLLQSLIRAIKRYLLNFLFSRTKCAVLCRVVRNPNTNPKVVRIVNYTI